MILVLTLLNGMVTQSALFFTHRQSDNTPTIKETELSVSILPPITTGALLSIFRMMEQNQKKKLMDWMRLEGILDDENMKPPLRLY